MSSLDFLIIGAQKCATTTLFEQLRVHPDIAMPVEKEVPFFTREQPTSQDWEQFAREHFGPDDGRMRGKASPQYLSDPDAARRIATLMPEIKLVAILRDPIERSWSHYRMDQRRGTESRSFQDVVEGLLEPKNAELNRNKPVPTHQSGYESEAAFHVAWSEYGRAIKPYREHFSEDQLLVIYLEELALEPEATFDRLLAFLGLETGFRPPALGKVIHAGGAGNRVPHGWRVWLRDQPGIRQFWEAIPERRRGRLRFLYERWNGSSRNPVEDPQLDSRIHGALRDHFAEDLRHLERLGVATPPWADRYAV